MCSLRALAQVIFLGPCCSIVGPLPSMVLYLGTCGPNSFLPREEDHMRQVQEGEKRHSTKIILIGE